MSSLRSAAFGAYRWLPHRLVNRTARLVAQSRRPARAVEWAIAAWIRHDRIDMTDFEAGPFASIEAFFLRRLRPGARPIGEGLVSPVDGRVVAEGAVTSEATFALKGHPVSLGEVVNGGRHGLSLKPYCGGRFISVFLSPRGYHRIHMPLAGEIVDARWIPGRFFPQNERALRVIPGVYERNERLVLRCRSDGGELLLVLVGASVVGGIHLDGARRTDWARAGVTPLALRRERGEEIAHFTFGSTVVMVAPPALAPRPLPRPGLDLSMGESLLA